MHHRRGGRCDVNFYRRQHVKETGEEMTLHVHCGGTCVVPKGTQKCAPSDEEPGGPDGPEEDDDGDGDKCGPDVRAALNLSLVRLETLVNHVFSPWQKASLCTAGWVRWDFVELRPGEGVTTDHCPQGKCCDTTVWVGTGCHPDWAVNWSFFGAAARICGYSLFAVEAYLAGTTATQDAIKAVILKLEGVEDPDCYSTSRHIALKNAWLIAGYNQALTGAPIVPPAAPQESAHCGMCPERWQHKGPFGIHWGFYSE